jgi:SPP1 family phage portal protein
MTLEQLESLMFTTDITRVINVLEVHLLVKNIFDALKEYEPRQHKVNDKAIRQDKMIKNESGAVEKIIPVARLSLALQKKIVTMQAAFLGVPHLDSNPQKGKEEDLMTVVSQVWEANKLDFKFKRIVKATLSERHCAELWFPMDVDQSYWEGYPISAKYKLSMMVLANSANDQLYPVFDEYGNMIAFGRAYFIRVVNDSSAVDMVQHFDLYTEKDIYYAKKQGNSWIFSAGGGLYESAELVSVPNQFGKIPVIYYSQPYTAWEDVQPLIERLETKLSNHADTNDYFDSPIVFIEGDIEGFAEKGEQGKVLIGKNGAKASYLTWNNAPESTKMEVTNLLYFIHSLTHTPDISFDNLKGLGRLTGVALKLLFMDAHLKAAENEEVFGEGLQRRLNWIKKAVSVLDPSFKPALTLKISAVFKYFLPEDIDAEITTLVAAVGGGILSQQTAVDLNPLVTDGETELATIQKEGDAAQKKAQAAAAALPKPTPQPEPASAA